MVIHIPLVVDQVHQVNAGLMVIIENPACPIFSHDLPEKRNLTQLLRIYKIVRSAKYARFRDFAKRDTYGTPFTLIGALGKPGLTSAGIRSF